VAALLIGPRRDYRRVPLVPHNVPLTLLGAGLLWFGWFGFNAGSALGANEVASVAFVTTFAAPAAALLVWIVLDQIRLGHITAVGAATGLVVGLVAVTPAAGFVTPVSALAIGAIGAFASYFAIQVRSRTKVDDALDVFACHGVAGIVGALLTGVFATTSVNPAGRDGLLYGNPAQLVTQAIGVITTILFAGVLTAVILKLVSVVTPLRVAVSAELSGVDLSEHGETAHDFDEFGIGAGHRPPSLGGSVIVTRRSAEPTTEPRPQPSLVT
jgi:Amt family ammonium transporter